MKSFIFIFAALVLSSCGRQDATYSGLAADQCSNTEEQLNAEIQLRHQNEVALLKVLRSNASENEKVSAIDKLIVEEKDFEKRNGNLCRSDDGTLRSASISKDMIPFLERARQDVLDKKSLSWGLINLLDAEALKRDFTAKELEQRWTKHLSENCGIELTWKSDKSHKILATASKTRVDAAVSQAIAKEQSNTIPLENIVAALSESVSTLTAENIQLLGERRDDANDWKAARDYLEILGTNLSNIMKNLETLRKDPKSLAPYWPAE